MLSKLAEIVEKGKVVTIYTDSEAEELRWAENGDLFLPGKRKPISQTATDRLKSWVKNTLNLCCCGECER